MSRRTNKPGQSIGSPLPNWQPPSYPPKKALQGHSCRVEPLDIDTQLNDLYAAVSLDGEGHSWTYLGYGPFRSIDDYRTWLQATCLCEDPIFFAIIDVQQAKAVFGASYLNIVPGNGSIEVGHIYDSPLLQRTPAATAIPRGSPRPITSGPHCAKLLRPG